MKLTAILSALVLALGLSACTARSVDAKVTAAQPVQEQQVPTTEQQASTTEQQPTEQTEKQLTRDEVVAIALKAAGAENSDVWELDAERDRERGTVVWEVDFEFEYREYSYVLDAQTGEILYEEVERD